MQPTFLSEISQLVSGKSQRVGVFKRKEYKKVDFSGISDALKATLSFLGSL